MKSQTLKKETGRLKGLLALLVVAVLVAVWVRFHFLKPEGLEERLHGHQEEATVALAEVLAKIPPAERLPRLLQYLNDPSPGLRYAALDALSEYREAQVVEAVEKAFTDSFSEVRLQVLYMLPQMDRERGLRLLLSALKDDDTWVRRDAVSQLRLLKDQRAVPMLLETLKEADPTTRLLAMNALFQITGQPIRVKATEPEEKQRAAIARWQEWWAGARDRWTLPPEWTQPSPIHPTRADPAPDLELRDLAGDSFRLADQRGHLVLLNFWGTWCPPCRAEIPLLVRLHRTYGGRGLEIVGIAVSEPEGEQGVRRWCQANGVPYRQTLATSRVLEAYGVHGVPVSVLIDAQGQIRYRWEGDRDFQTFQAAVQRLLK